MMAEMTFASDAGSDELLIANPQHSTHSECNNSVTGALPTEGYRVFYARPTVELPTSVARDTLRNLNTLFPTPSSDRHDTSLTSKILSATSRVVVKYWSRLMLIFVPFGLAAPYTGLDSSAVFVLNCLATIPLADVLCQATDSMASYTGETTGALVNLTVGNLIELVIFIHALIQQQYVIVRTSLLGSIVVNILLVLGLAILTGEVCEQSQVYNVLATRVAAGLICLTTISLLVPSTLKFASDDLTTAHKMIHLRRATSIVLIVVYFLYLWKQIRSEKYAYKPLVQIDDTEVPDMEDSVDLGRANMLRQTLPYAHAPLLSPSLLSVSDSKSYDSFDNSAADPLYCNPGVTTMGKLSAAMDAMITSAWTQRMTPVIVLIASTALISMCSGNLVSRVDHLVAHSPISKTMVGLVILPIIGNAAELVSGVLFASRKQIELAFAVSIGSAIQIALFVTPLVILIAWGMDRDTSLHFTAFESVALAVSSVLFLMLVFDSRCSVLKGACLCVGYAMIAMASYFVTDAV